MNTTILVVLIAYLGVMLCIGYYFSRKKMTEEDFLLGGKKLPGWGLAFSERATAESAWLLLGATGFVYTAGLSAFWLLIGNFMGIVVVWLFVAQRVMRETNKTNVLTLPDMFSEKFKRHAKLIRWFASVVLVCFFTFYIAAQFSGAGKTLQTTFGISRNTGVILSAVIVVLYAMMGGFMSVVWTDVIQSTLMLLTLVLLPIVAFIQIQSADLSVTTALAQVGNGADSFTSGLTGFALTMMIFSNASWFFGFLGGQPQLASRFMALKDEKDCKIGRNVALVWAVLAYSGVFFIGIFAITLYGPGVVADSEMILPYMLNDLLPDWLAGLLLAGVIAAMMSTADSQLLVLTSSVTEDIMHKSLKMRLTEKQLVTVARGSILVAGIVGLIISYTSSGLVFSIVSYAWSGIGCTFSAALLMALFWKRTSSAGIAASLICGFLGTIIWMNTPLEAIFTSRAATFLIAVAAGVGFSLFFPDSEEDKAEAVSATS